MVRHASRYCFVAFMVLSCAGALAAATAPLAAIHWDDANQRWRDVATNPFAAAKKANLFYDCATVTVTYDDSAGTFRGTLVATNLKPNFAYQIKLSGKPTRGWTDGDDWANEQLGYNGRWWVDQYDSSGTWVSGWNSTDTEYARWKKRDFTDRSYVYVFQGYMLFENLVTDNEGKAAKSFALDSSFHVLWKTSQRTRTANDSTPVTYTVAPTASAWYSKDYPSTDVSIYAEWQSGRPLPGKVRLPNGKYNVRLCLTEESFHETAEDSGNWATVMCYDYLAFSVQQQPPPTLDSVTALDTKSGGQYSITATVNNPGPATTLTLTCVVPGQGNNKQTLQQQTVNVPAAGTAKVTWTDAVASSIKPGTYTATVTIVQTGESKASNAFTVSKR